MGLVGVIRKEWNTPYMTGSHWDAMLSGKRPPPPSDFELDQGTRQLPQDVGHLAAGAPSSITEEEMPVNDPRGDLLSAEGQPMVGVQGADFDPTDLSHYMEDEHPSGRQTSRHAQNSPDPFSPSKVDNTQEELGEEATKRWGVYHKLEREMKSNMAEQKKRQPSRFKDVGFVHTKGGPKKLDPNTGLTQGMMGMLNAKKRDAEQADKKYRDYLASKEKQNEQLPLEEGADKVITPELPSGKIRVAPRKKKKGRKLGVTRGGARRGTLAARRAGPTED